MKWIKKKKNNRIWDGTQPPGELESLFFSQRRAALRVKVWRRRPPAVVTCLGFVCLCPCLPASSGVVHLFPNLFYVPLPNVVPLHANYSEEMFSSLQNILSKRHFCAVWLDSQDTKALFSPLILHFLENKLLTHNGRLLIL